MPGPRLRGRRPTGGARCAITCAITALVVTCATLVTVPTAPATAAVGPDCNDPQTRGRTDPAVNQAKGSRPIVYVHGWTGTPMTKTADMLNATLGGAVTHYQFDYGNYASYWASSDHIAPCLADYINSVSADWVNVGGDGRVIVVAHSMGGIATRYAFTSKYAAHPVTAAQVGVVITLSTPYTGSPLGQTFGAAFKEVGGRLLGNALPGLTSGDGGACLAPHVGTQPLPATQALPIPTHYGDVAGYLPAGIPVTEIGGDITVDRSLFGHVMYSIGTKSDGIVPLASAQGYASGGPTRPPPQPP